MYRTVWERDYDGSLRPGRTRKQVSASLDLLQRMELQRTLQGHDGCVNSCSFDPTGTLLCTGSDDLKICIWDWEAGECLHAFCTHASSMRNPSALPWLVGLPCCSRLKAGGPCNGLVVMLIHVEYCKGFGLFR
jgi:WD repeat-containing protein 42A